MVAAGTVDCSLVPLAPGATAQVVIEAAMDLLGLDHTRLTYRYAGRDFRMTDVYGNVVQEILA